MRGPVMVGVMAATVAGLLAGCKPGAETHRSRPGPVASMVVLDSVVSNSPWGPDFFPDAERASAGADPSTVLPHLGPDRVLVIPDARSLPVHWWTPLEEFYHKGGAVLFCGLAPLQDRVRLEQGQPVTEAVYLSNLVQGARAAGGFSSIRTWMHENDSGELRGAVILAEKNAAPWPAVEVEVERFSQWDGLVFDAGRARPVQRGENTLAFYARGDQQTFRLFVECLERDGSHWGTPVEIGPRWGLIVLHQGRFRRLDGGSEQGRGGEGFRLANLAWIRIGLNMNGAPQSPGDHRFGLSDVRLLADPRPREEAIGWPGFPLVSPPHRNFSFTGAALRDLERDTTMKLAAVPLGSPVALPPGGYDPAPESGRWIPLFAAEEASGKRVGWPVSFYMHEQAEGPPSRCGWVGLEPKGSLRPLANQAVAVAVRHMILAPRFRYARCSRWVYREREEIQATVAWAGPPDSPPVRISAELRRANEERVMRRIVLSSVAPGRVVPLNLGLVPLSGAAADDVCLMLRLENLRVPTVVYDRMELALKVVSGRAGDPVKLTTAGGRFLTKDAALALAGVHYAPPVENPRTGQPADWLDPRWFDPARVSRDLQQIRAAGFNTLLLEYGSEKQAHPLQYVLEEAHRHRLMVILSVGGLNPLALDWNRAERLLKSAAIANAPAVVAFHVPVSGIPRVAGEVTELQSEWEAWRREQQEVAGKEGPSGDAEPALSYAHFLEDQVSQQIGWLRRHLQAQGFHQMLTGCYGGGPSEHGQMPKYPGVVHWDFVSLLYPGSTRAADDGDQKVLAADRVNRLSGGKPLLWQARVWDVGPGPREPDLETQAQWTARFLKGVLQTRAAGCLLWSFSGGGRPPRWADEGLTGSDGNWRPAGRAFVNALPSLRMEQLVPVQQPLDVAEKGGRLNAEWGRIEVDGLFLDRRPGESVVLRPGQTLKCELINTGGLAWPGGVRVARTGGGSEEWIPTRPLRVAEREGLVWRAGGPGDYGLRPWEPVRGFFGERLRVRVQREAEGRTK